jgi:hypothetical protein
LDDVFEIEDEVHAIDAWWFMLCELARLVLVVLVFRVVVVVAD